MTLNVKDASGATVAKRTKSQLGEEIDVTWPAVNDTLASVSGTIATGGTAQDAAAANAARVGFWIQNLSTGDLWISTLAPAVQDQPSLRIPPGALYESPPFSAGVGAISIIGATTGQKYVGREW